MYSIKNIINAGVILLLLFIVINFHTKSSKVNIVNIDCSKSSENLDKYNCWEKIINETLDERGLSESFEIISKIYNEDPGFTNYCHNLTHSLGKKAYLNYVKNKDFELGPEASYCGYGFYHGFMENLLLAGENLDQVGEFCDKGYHEGNAIGDACYHGAGHGAEAIAVTEPEVWGDKEKMFSKALYTCSSISEGDKMRYSNCATGVFMEAAIYFNEGSYELKFDRNNPFDICENVKEDSKLECHNQLYPILSYISGGDLSKAVKYVEKVIQDRYASAAMETLSGSMVNVKKTNYETDIEVCRNTQKRLHIPCIRGLALGFILNSSPGNEFMAAKDLCLLNNMNEAEKEACFDMALRQSNGSNPKSKMMQFCEETPKQYRNQICETYM